MMQMVRKHPKELFLRRLGIDLQEYTSLWTANPEGLGGIMLEMDATNSVKFSRHVIVVLDSKCLFRNVHHVKEFATDLHQLLWKSNCRITKVVANELTNSTLVDLGVYNNNQNFRVLLSSKYAEKGKRPLNFYLPQRMSSVPIHNLTYEKFCYTLVACNGIRQWNLLAWPTYQQQNKRGRLNEVQNVQAAIPVYNQNNANAIVKIQELRNIPSRSNKLANDQYPKLKTYFATQVLPSWPLLLKSSLPPFQYIGVITNVEYQRHNRNFIYVKVIVNKFCHNVQRQHRSNNIYFVVDLRQFVFRQGCYDIACNGVLSRALPIPPEILF